MKRSRIARRTPLRASALVQAFAARPLKRARIKRSALKSALPLTPWKASIAAQRYDKAKFNAGRYRRTQVEMLDALCREVVMLRDRATCQYDRPHTCGTLAWAHVASRRYRSTRWDVANSLALCHGAHILWHQRPLEMTQWFRDRWPDRAAHLQRMATLRPKIDAGAMKLYLESERARLLRERGEAV